MGTETFLVVARVLSGAEREEYLAKQSAVQPQFAEYQSTTDRLNPVIELVRAQQPPWPFGGPGVGRRDAGPLLDRGIASEPEDDPPADAARFQAAMGFGCVLGREFVRDP